MASLPPFALDDQTDEDFFDKLVADDDDINIGSFKVTDLKAHYTDNGHDTNDANELGKLSPNSDERNISAYSSKDSDNAKAFANTCNDLDESKVPANLSNDFDEVKALSNLSVDPDEIIALANLSNDSDEVKAFANLSLSQNENGVDDIEVIRKSDGSADVVGKSNQEKDPNVGEAGSSLVPASSFLSDGFTSNEHVIESNAESELTSSKSGDSASFGVKEVQWSAFADSAADAGNAFGSYSDFYSELGDGIVGDLASESNIVSSDPAGKISNSEYAYSLPEHQGEQVFYTGQSVNEHVLSSSQYWETSYPGWMYDANSGQWYQVDGHDMTTNGQQNSYNTDVNLQGNTNTNAHEYLTVSGSNSAHVYNSHGTAQPLVGAITQGSPTENVSTWNQASQANGEYPAHIVSDPQYRGWLYDTNEQKWITLEQYHSSQSMFQAHCAYEQSGFTSTSNRNDSSFSTHEQPRSWSTALSGYTQHGTNAWQPEVLSQGKLVTDSSSGQQYQNAYGSDHHFSDHVAQGKPFNSMETVPSYMNPIQGNESSNWAHSLNTYVPDLPPDQQFNMPVETEQNGHVQYPSNYDSSKKAYGLSEQFFPQIHQISHPMNGGRSSAGRPPHALVAFGFGGKLMVMKDSTSGSVLHGMKDAERFSVSLINVMEVVMDTNNASGIATDTSGYFNALCHRSFPGPLVGGNAGGKELNNWIEEQVLSCQSSNVDYRKGKSLKLLLCLLKIGYQHYGKLRSLSTDTFSRENDLPELAVANLFASAKENTGQLGAYASGTKYLKNSPSQAQIQATASEVQNLLINGKKREALQCAQEGQLWEFALILAHELGDQFYVDTLRQLALSQLVDGTPLRTLCLLIAKRPEDVFTSNNMAVSGLSPGQISQHHDQSAGYNMLDNWEENLAIITANKPENDHLVITHLGDCLWKERNDIIAAHVCYLVTGADAHIQAYSESTRLCLIGADHWNFPRTYASPEAIQRTEFYEYSKVLGNTQYVLLQFQPYKLIYAHMLAEMGKISDSLKYCQAMHKSLKAGRSPEAEILKQQLFSFEERLRMHQQGGYAANSAPAKIVGKLLNFFDSTANRVVGGPPPPVPSTVQSFLHSNELHNQMTKVSSSPTVMAMSSLTPSSSTEFVNQWAVDSNQVSGGPAVTSSQSTMAVPSLTTAASMELSSQWAVDGNKMSTYNRSISEPDIGRTAEQDRDSSSKANSSGAERKASATTGLSRLSRFNFGAQILQKTVGLVIKPRQGQQAKLGEQNKFYFDKALNKWVEEGAEPPAEEATPPPPPTTAFFQNTTNAEAPAATSIPESRNESSPGIPLAPPSTNKFTARSRMGVRARYVDTFNKGGASPANNFQLPILPPVKPASVTSAKFFVPTPMPINEQSSEMVDGSTQSAAESGDSPPVSMSQPLENKSPPPVTMPMLPTADSSTDTWIMEGENDSHSYPSQDTASWSGGDNNSFTPSKMHELNPSSEALGMSPLSSMSTGSSLTNLQTGGDLGDDLHEVEF